MDGGACSPSTRAMKNTSRRRGIALAHAVSLGEKPQKIAKAHEAYRMVTSWTKQKICFICEAWLSQVDSNSSCIPGLVRHRRILHHPTSTCTTGPMQPIVQRLLAADCCSWLLVTASGLRSCSKFNARMMSTAQFVLQGCGPNPFVQLPGFHVEQLANDWLHVLDLALTPGSAASALIELTETPGIWDGATQDERLKKAYVDFKALCRSHRIRALSNERCSWLCDVFKAGACLLG